MARRDPGNKPALRIGAAWVAVLVIIAAILVLFVTRMSHPATNLPRSEPTSAR